MKRTRAIAAKETYDEITTLVRQLDSTQRRIQELVGGELDSVLHPGGRSYLLHQAQEKLRESENLYHALFENMLEGCAYCQLVFDGDRAVDYIYVTVNRAFEVQTGLRDVVGKKVSEVVPGMHEANPEQLEIYSRVARTSQPETFESYAWQLGIWFSVSAYSNQANHFVVIFENITERKKAADRLQASEAILQLFILHTPAAIAMFDNDMRYLNVSERWMQEYRLNGREIIGQSHYDVFPDAPERWKEIHQRVLTGAVERCEEDAFPRADGTIDWLQWELRPWHHPGGGIGGLIMFTQMITERKKEEAEVVFNEQRFRCLVEASSEIVWDMPASGEFETEQPGWSAFTGQSFEEYRGVGWLAAIHPDDHAETIRLWSAAFASHSNYSAEQRVRARDQTYRHMAVRAVPVLGETGEIRQWIGIHTDITERKLAEENLRLLHSAVMQSRESILITEANLDLPGPKIIFVNPAFTKMSGYTSEEAIGRTPRILQGPQTDRAVIQRLRKNLDNGETFVGETTNYRKDGTSYAHEWSIAPILDGNGKITHYVANQRDVSQRRQEQKLLLESRERLALATESAHLGIWDWDVVANTTFWDRQMKLLYGIREEDFTTGFDTWERGRHPEDKERTDGEVANALAGNAVFHSEFRVVWPNGEVHYLEAHAVVKRSEDGTARRMIGVNWDVTERKKLEQQFLRAQRMEGIGTLAGGIAHDLNNMLSPIIMSIELLKMKVGDPAGQELLAIISSSAQRGADMVSQVLSFARGVEGRRIDVPISPLLRDLEKLSKDTFQKNIQVNSIIPDDLWSVVGDPTQLHQVLLNLCINARDAMPDGGTLTLSARNIELDAQYVALNPEAHVGPYVTLRVEDTGSGMPVHIVEKIFDPFFTTKELGKGTGLGLSTTMAIVKSHAGFLQVYSEIGKGTVFSIYLPAITQKSALAIAGAEREMPRGHGELILIVDDESSIRQITQQTLTAFGYRVILAADGTEAVATYALRAKEIAIVLTDIMMPLMDGPAMIRVLYKLNPDVRIIAASGLTANSEVTNLGVKHFLPKPYTAQTMLRLLRKVLSDEPS